MTVPNLCGRDESSHFLGVDSEAVTIDGDDGVAAAVPADDEEKLLLLVSSFPEGVPPLSSLLVLLPPLLSALFATLSQSPLGPR